MADDSTPSAGGNTGAAPVVTQTPEPISLSDDSFVKLPGSDKPVKWGDHYRGFQSQFTKTAQEKAKLEQTRQSLEQQVKDRDVMVQRLQQALGVNNQTPPTDPYADLKSRQYLDGEAAYKLAQSLRGEVGSFGSALGQRDQVILALAKQLAEIKKSVGEFSTQRQGQEFENKIKKWVTDLELDGFEDLAKEVYLAYEGDDLDNEFPTIFKNRVQQVEAAIRARDKKRLETRRQLPFTPAKGGNGSAGKPISLADKNAREVTDILWEQMNGGEEA